MRSCSCDITCTAAAVLGKDRVAQLLDHGRVLQYVVTSLTVTAAGPWLSAAVVTSLTVPAAGPWLGAAVVEAGDAVAQLLLHLGRTR